MIENKGEFDIVLPDHDDTDIVPDVDYEDIAEKIQGGRRECDIGHTHYSIIGPPCKTEEKAVNGFWDIYEAKQPIAIGAIFWRLRPTMMQDGDTYRLLAKFSIGQP